MDDGPSEQEWRVANRAALAACMAVHHSERLQWGFVLDGADPFMVVNVLAEMVVTLAQHGPGGADEVLAEWGRTLAQGEAADG